MPFKPCRKKALIKVPYNLLQMVSVHVSYRPSRQILEDKSQFEKHRRVSQTVAVVFHRQSPFFSKVHPSGRSPNKGPL